MRKLIFISISIVTVIGTPQTSFPFNSQVPEVAQVGQPYYFDLNPSTFTSNNGPMTYALNGAPQWLQMVGKNGSLYGFPGPGDVGEIGRAHV